MTTLRKLHSFLSVVGVVALNTLLLPLLIVVGTMLFAMVALTDWLGDILEHHRKELKR